MPRCWPRSSRPTCALAANHPAANHLAACHPALDRYAEAARLLTGQPGATIQDGLAWIRETLVLLAVPGLATFGLGPQQADEVAAKAMTSSSMQGNPVPLSHEDLRAALIQAL